MHKALLSLAAFGALAATPAAQAAMISYTALTEGASSASLNDGLTATANVRTFEQKTIAGVTGAGISGGTVGGEIDATETLSFTGGTAGAFLNGFTIAFLYGTGNMGDAPNEVLLLDIAGSSTMTILLSADGTLSGTGSAGAVTILSPATDAGAGELMVSGLDLQFTSLVFKSGNAGGTAASGDFAFVNLTYSVPEPASLALLSAGLFGAGMIRRRQGR